MSSRTGGALAIRPIGTSRGTWLCFSILTGKLTRRHSWTSLPIDDIIVNRLHDLAKLNGSADHPDGCDPNDLDLNVGNDCDIPMMTIKLILMVLMLFLVNL